MHFLYGLEQPIEYQEFYNKNRGLPEPIWGGKAKQYKGISLQCPVCGSTDVYYSGDPDDPEEIFTDSVRCKNCGRITDWYEAYTQGLYHHTEKPLMVVRR